MNYALTETNGDQKIAPGYYLFIVPCPKGPVKGYHFLGPLMECDSVCNEHYSLQQIPNMFAEGAT